MSHSSAQLMTALRNADAAGDTESAKRIAQMIKGAQEQPAQQPQAPSKLDMIKQGFGMAKDYVQGDAEFQDAGDTADYFRQQANANPLQQMQQLASGESKLTDMLDQSGVAMFGNDADTKAELAKNPNIKFVNDAQGNEMFVDETGEARYINQPGIDPTQVAKAIGQGSLYTAGGALPSLAKGVIGKAGLGGLGATVANVAQQNLAGRENIDVGEAGMSGAMGGAFSGAGALINKVRNARAGNTNLPQAKQDVVDYARKEKMPLAFDDVTESPLARRAGQQFDAVSGKFRRAQNEAQKAKALETTQKHTLPDSNLDDLYDAVSGGAKKHQQRSKDIASKKFTKAYEELDKSKGNFDAGDVKQKAQELMKKELAFGSDADPAVIKALESYVDIPAGNFSHWADVRSRLTGKTMDLSKSMASKNTRVESALKQVNKELNKSLDDVAGGSQKWRDANKFYKDAVVRYTKPALKNAMKEDNPDKLLDLFMNTGKTFDNKKMATARFNSLDKQGKAAVRQGMMQKAYEDALTDVGDFSAAKYATALKKFENRLGVVLSKEDNQAVKGLRNYMRATQAASGFGRNTPTGEKAIPAIYTAMAMGGASLNMPVTVAALTGASATKKLFRTARGRSFLLAMSNIPKGKKPPPKLMVDIARYLAVKPSED